MIFKDCTCSICGKKFDSKNTTRKPKVCYDDHYSICEYCGNKFKLNPNSYRIPKCCSKACASKLIKKKSEQTNLERYGVKNSGGTKKSVEKRKKTCIERYGIEDPGNSKQGREKARRTWKKKYGTDNPQKVESIKKKSESTCLSRYGAKNPLCKESILRPLIKSKNLEIYGTFDPGNMPESQERRKKTNIERFGVEYYTQSPEYKDKRIETCLSRYGVTHPMKLDEVKDRQRKTCFDHYGVSNPMKNPESLKKLSERMMKTYGVPWPCMTPQCIESQGGRISKINKRFGEYLDENNILHSFEFPIGRKLFDFYLPDYNILIDINPSYTHTIKDVEKFHSIDINHHIDRTKIAEDSGYWLIHVWQWDDWDDVLNLIVHSEFEKFIYRKDNKIYVDRSKIGISCANNIGLKIKEETLPSIHWSKDKNHMFDYEVEDDLSNTNWLPVPDCGYLICEDSIYD